MAGLDGMKRGEGGNRYGGKFTLDERGEEKR